MRLATGGLIAALALAGCAQVPRESVELSTTVGRDLAELHRAHRETVVLLYDRMERDVNEFVDEVYAPYQIRRTLEQHGETLHEVIGGATASGATADDERAALEFLGVYVDELRRDIEAFRTDTLEPLRAQERALLADIDEAYRRVHDANSVVTGHLASVVKVHDAQAEALEAADLAGLRGRIGERLGSLAARLGGFVDEARRSEEKVDKLAEDLQGLVGGEGE
ncbi:MAG: hypothetical protein GWO02_01485 [Gammaproteobacteria bacterium]|nr:hypothetical protein [Gammaproteobacteria bacterium]